jgi:hypothetical protein
MDKLKQLLKISFDDFCEKYLEFFTILLRNTTHAQKQTIKRILDEKHEFTPSFVEKLDIYVFIDDNLLFDDEINELFVDIIFIKGCKEIYHIKDNQQMLKILNNPVNIQFFDDCIDIDKYEIPTDFVNFMDEYCSNDDLKISYLPFFQTDSQQEFSQYYEFQSYLPFFDFLSITFCINVNKMSDDYGKVILYDTNDCITGFYHLYDYQKFIDVYKKINYGDIFDKISNDDDRAIAFRYAFTEIDENEDIMIKSASKLN